MCAASNASDLSTAFVTISSSLLSTFDTKKTCNVRTARTHSKCNNDDIDGRDDIVNSESMQRDSASAVRTSPVSFSASRTRSRKEVLYVQSATTDTVCTKRVSDVYLTSSTIHLLPSPISLRTLFVVFSVLLGIMVSPSCGGTCWSAMVRNGKCKEVLSNRVTHDECCATNSVTTAYSHEDYDSGVLFFWRILGGGVPCQTCKQTCVGVQCGEGKRCVQRRSGPRCVCAPDCRAESRTGTAGAMVKGPVCGTDGRSYRTLCRLRKRACRRKSNTLSVAYHGPCQNTCDAIRCPTGKHCLVDQNLSPHCVRCARNCTGVDIGASRQVCGADGVTYASVCHLREAACHRGRAIPVAYRGRCKQSATCSTVRCRERQQCLSDPVTAAPRCVTCGVSCPRRPPFSHVCGTNRRTYRTWCHMLRDACATGYVLETLHAGACRHNQSTSLGAAKSNKKVNKSVKKVS